MTHNITIDRDGDQFVITDKETDVTTQGESKIEALMMLADALALESDEEIGTAQMATDFLGDEASTINTGQPPIIEENQPEVTRETDPEFEESEGTDRDDPGLATRLIRRRRIRQLSPHRQEVDETKVDGTTVSIGVPHASMVEEIGYGVIGRAQAIHDNPDDEYELVARYLRDLGQQLIDGETTPSASLSGSELDEIRSLMDDAEADDFSRPYSKGDSSDDASDHG